MFSMPKKSLSGPLFPSLNPKKEHRIFSHPQEVFASTRFCLAVAIFFQILFKLIRKLNVENYSPEFITTKLQGFFSPGKLSFERFFD